MTSKTKVLIISVMLILILGPCFGPLSRYLAAAVGLRAATAWQVIAFFLALGVVFGVTRMFMRQDGITLADLGWLQPSTTLAVVLGAVLGVLWAVLLAFGYLRYDPKANLLEMSFLRLFTAVVGACGALLEDMITRAYIMEQFKRMTVPTWLQVVASSLLFALYHSLWWGNLPGFIGGFIASLIYGLILAGLYILGKRSLTPVILAHSLAVFIGEPFLTMTLIVAAQGG